MRSNILQLAIFVSSVNVVIYGTRTAKNGHILLSGISMAARDFGQQVIQVANRIVELQVLYDDQPDRTISRYIIPVYLYVHEATRVSQSPVYLGLNVQPSDTNSTYFPGYLKLVEVYDETYSEPIVQYSPLNTVAYPPRVPPFSPMHSLDRHNVIGGLRDNVKIKQIMRRLSLVFVESIRFHSVREAVQEALRLQGMIDFYNHMVLIRNWETKTDEIVQFYQKTNDFIQPGQQLDPALSQLIFSVGILHMNAGARLNLWFLYQFIRCHNHFHQQQQDGGDWCDINKGTNIKWKVGCDFKSGKELGTHKLNPQNCTQTCQQIGGCTHFTWASGTCVLKHGKVLLQDEIKTLNLHATCGIMAETPEKSSVDNCRNGIGRGLDGTLKVTDITGQNHVISNRYGWSSHNCRCRGKKTGLVLYPRNTMYKNIVLLLCDSCYDYQPNAGARHEQLMQWYADIYRTERQFRLLSGFYLKTDGSLEFNSWSQNRPGLYTDNINQVNACEQDVIRKVINGQLQSYTV